MESIPHPVNSGIRKATTWYNSHISLSRPPVRGQAKPVLPDVVLLTDDAANRQKAEKEGIKCMSGTWAIHAKHAAGLNATFQCGGMLKAPKTPGSYSTCSLQQGPTTSNRRKLWLLANPCTQMYVI